MDMKDKGKKPVQSLYKRRGSTTKKISARKLDLPLTEDESIEQKVKKLFSGQDELFDRIKPRKSSEKVSSAINEIVKASKPLAKKARVSTSRHAKKVIRGIRARRSGKNSRVESLLSGKKITYIVQRTKSHPKAVAGMGAFLAASVFAVFSMAITKQSSKPIATGSKDKNGKSVTEVAGATSSPETKTNLTTDKPSFTVVTPGGKSDVQGIERKAPTGDFVYTYVDSINDTRVEISEQKLPSAFEQDPSVKLAEFAKTSYLLSIIQVDATTVYHGINDKSGVQTVVFIKNDLLVFIKSSKKLTDDDWVGYISNLY
jgi:hypothetical protein